MRQDVARRIAMWSGPRNISTAMLRSWGNRPDTSVVDEPLYAHYLAETRAAHPGRDEVLRAHETDWRKVVATLTGPVPGGRSVWYQKHMTHHLLPSVGRDWLDGVEHAFLIRDPAAMLASLAAKLDTFDLDATGLPQQVELFEWACRASGRIAPVVDAEDVLRDPRGTLGLLCERLELPFDEAMLSWPAGPRTTDGVWARHWYQAVELSTGFKPFAARRPEVPPAARPLLDACRALYDRLRPHRLAPVARA